MYDLIRLVNVEKTSWNEHNGLPTFRPIYPFFESLRPFWTLKKLSDPNENLHSCLYLKKEHFPHRADINFQKSPFSTYPTCTQGLRSRLNHWRLHQFATLSDHAVITYDLAFGRATGFQRAMPKSYVLSKADWEGLKTDIVDQLQSIPTDNPLI